MFSIWHPPWNKHSPWKWMVGILLSFWDDLFSGAVLVSESLLILFYPRRPGLILYRNFGLTYFWSSFAVKTFWRCSPCAFSKTHAIVFVPKNNQYTAEAPRWFIPKTCRMVFLTLDFWRCEKNWVVVSNIFYFHPYLGKWSNLTNIFQMGWNHQLENPFTHGSYWPVFV